MIFPPREVGKLDTGLRFTDILFGFVIREIFLRLQQWGDLPAYVRWQLIAATVLVLGSWIGFRRSLNRPGYELKFFNLPFFMFVLDQVMVITYFRVATRTPQDPTADAPPSADALVDTTLEALLLIFGLYITWDLLAAWMAKAKDRTDPARGLKYPKIDRDKKEALPGQARKPDIRGLAITVLCAALLGVLTVIASKSTIDSDSAITVFVVAAAVLLLYRWLKEAKASLWPA